MKARKKSRYMNMNMKILIKEFGNGYMVDVNGKPFDFCHSLQGVFMSLVTASSLGKIPGK